LVGRELARHLALVVVLGAEAAPEVRLLLEVGDLGRVEDRDHDRVVAADRDPAVQMGALRPAVELDDGGVEGAVELADIGLVEHGPILRSPGQRASSFPSFSSLSSSASRSLALARLSGSWSASSSGSER